MTMSQGTVFSHSYARNALSTINENDIAWAPSVGTVQVRALTTTGSGASFLGYLNNVQVGGSNRYNDNPLSSNLTAGLYLGGYYNGNTASMGSYNDQDILEVIIYNVVVTALERTAIHNMLAARWGL